MDKIYTGRVPFRNGVMCDCDPYYRRADVEERVVEPFEATLHLTHMGRGRSAAPSYWSHTRPADEEVDGKKPDWRNHPPYEYVMMFVNFHQIMRKLERGALHGWWAVRKQGANYGIFYLGETKPETEVAK